MFILYTLQRGRLPIIGLELSLPGSSCECECESECESESESGGGGSGQHCQSLSLKGLPFPD